MKSEPNNTLQAKVAGLPKLIRRRLRATYRSVASGKTVKKPWKQMTIEERILFVAVLGMFALVIRFAWQWVGF
jgi:hypothetical protein